MTLPQATVLEEWQNLPDVEQASIVDSVSSYQDYFFGKQKGRKLVRLKGATIMSIEYKVSDTMTEEEKITYYLDFFKSATRDLKEARKKVKPSMDRLRDYVEEADGKRKS